MFVHHTTLIFSPQWPSIFVDCFFRSLRSPLVAGLLWDVTDRDVDRFTLRFLTLWLCDENDTDGATLKRPSLGLCVSSATTACKLKHLVGKSVIVYGLPVEPDPNHVLPTPSRCWSPTAVVHVNNGLIRICAHLLYNIFMQRNFNRLSIFKYLLVPPTVATFAQTETHTF